MSDKHVDRKAVMQPDNVARCLLVGMQGRALPITAGRQRDDFEKLLSDFPLEMREFSAGPDGVNEKLEFSNSGGVIVQNGIILVRGRAQLLLHQRVEASSAVPQGHRIVTGNSILLSGSGDKQPSGILNAKLDIDLMNPQEEVQLERIGISISDPAVSKGIYYLFHLFRGKIPLWAKIKSNTDDQISQGVTARKASAAVSGKTMEQNIIDMMVTNKLL